MDLVKHLLNEYENWFKMKNGRNPKKQQKNKSNK